MIRAIAAIDEQRGIANDSGIPWQGRIPTDVAYFREKTSGSAVMMGYGWYVEQKDPLPNRRNLVAIDFEEDLREGFERVDDARDYLKKADFDIWVGGGAGLFESTLDLIDELYITQLKGTYGCTKFFPEFKDKFELVSESKPHTEGDITFIFQVWKRKSS